MNMAVAVDFGPSCDLVGGRFFCPGAFTPPDIEPAGDHHRRARNREPVRELSKEDHAKQCRPYDLGIEKR